MSENIYIEPGTVYYPGLFDTEVALTIAEADRRYIKKGSDANYNNISVSGRLEVESANNTSITSSSNCDEYGLHLHAVLSSSTGIRSGSSIAFNNSTSDNVPLGAIALDKLGSGSGELVLSVRNGSTCDERLRVKSDGIDVNGLVQADTLTLTNNARNSLSIINTNNAVSANAIFSCPGISAMEFGLRGSTDTNPGDIYIWKGGFRLTFNNSTNLCRIYGALSTDGHLRAPLIGLGNNLPSSLTRDITILESSAEPDIVIGRADTNSNAFRISYTHVGDGNILNRLVIAPIGATAAQTLTYTASGRIGIGSPTPTQAFEVSGNINISNGNSYMIGGTSIDNRYLRADADTTNTVQLRLYGTQAAGASQNILRLGHQTASGDWYIRHYRDSNVANNTLDMLNTNSSLLGFSIGTFNGTSDGDGCMLVMNGIQGTGSTFLRANDPGCNGALHINAGIPQAVPANRRYGSSTSDPSNQSGGTVSISMYAYNDIWVRSNMYCTSDRRMKQNIKNWDVGNQCMNLLNVEPVYYSWKSDASNTLNLGFIAQDLIKHGCHDLVQTFKNDEVKERCEETNTDAGYQHVVEYQKVPLYLLEIIKKMHARLIKSEESIEKLISLLPKTKKTAWDAI